VLVVVIVVSALNKVVNITLIIVDVVLVLVGQAGREFPVEELTSPRILLGGVGLTPASRT
jgi:hypothetical protein